MLKKLKYILWYREINKDDSELVGGKNASLGEMSRNPTKKGIRIPNGFGGRFNTLQKAIKKRNELLAI